jgi:hypothetical protein
MDPYANQPLIKSIPSWWAPPSESPVLYKRGLEALLDPSWRIPIFLIIFGTITWFIAEMSMAILTSIMFIEVERLPYPFAPMDAAVAITLSERSEDKLKIFSLSALFAFLYSFILYGLPALGIAVFIPVPWVDFTRYTQYILPGALLGICTDIMPYAFGFLIPFHVVIYILIGSLAVWVFGNYFALGMKDHPYGCGLIQ